MGTLDMRLVRCQARASQHCNGLAAHKHHIKTRARGGSDRPENLLPVCHHCHEWIHQHLRASERLGLVLPSWRPEYATVPLSVAPIVALVRRFMAESWDRRGDEFIGDWMARFGDALLALDHAGEMEVTG